MEWQPLTEFCRFLRQFGKQRRVRGPSSNLTLTVARNFPFRRSSRGTERGKGRKIKTRPKIGLKWCASCGSFALSTISIVLSPADWYLNTFSFVIFLPDVSDNTINQHSPVEMQCNLLMSFHLMNPFPIRILFFPIINNHVSPKRSILRHPALLSVCVNDHRPTFISR